MSTEIEVAGIKLRGGKMFLVLTVLSSLVGALWGGFTFYKDYLDMKAQNTKLCCTRFKWF
jgi:hypothetical protein